LKLGTDSAYVPSLAYSVTLLESQEGLKQILKLLATYGPLDASLESQEGLKHAFSLPMETQEQEKSRISRRVETNSIRIRAP
jgi:hypothetical protein